VNDYAIKTSPNHVYFQVCNHKGVMQGTVYVDVHSVVPIWFYNLDSNMIAHHKLYLAAANQMVISHWL